MQRQKAGDSTLKASSPGGSPHNYGLAMDMNFSYKDSKTGKTVNVNSRSPKNIWKPIVDIAKKNKLRWGGDFKTNYDPVHFDVLKGPGLISKLRNIAKQKFGADVTKWPQRELIKIPNDFIV